MDTQKVRDLSTAQSPKATDFVMLITNLTNNVLEKCQVSALRDLMITNSISDDEDNALTTGSDDKLYVPDLTENIGIVASNLNDLSDDVNTVTNNLNALTGQVGQIQTKVNNISNLIAPDYSKVTSISLRDGYTFDKSGWLYIRQYFVPWGTYGTMYINGCEVNYQSTNGAGDGFSVPNIQVMVQAGDIFTITGSVNILLAQLIPFRGV